MKDFGKYWATFLRGVEVYSGSRKKYSPNDTLYLLKCAFMNYMCLTVSWWISVNIGRLFLGVWKSIPAAGWNTHQSMHFIVWHVICTCFMCFSRVLRGCSISGPEEAATTVEEFPGHLHPHPIASRDPGHPPHSNLELSVARTYFLLVRLAVPLPRGWVGGVTGLKAGSANILFRDPYQH